MGKAGSCVSPGSCLWIVEFRKSTNARMAKFRNDFRRKMFRDNKHLGTLGSDKLHNETGTRDMEIVKKTVKPATDSSLPRKTVAKKLTYDITLYVEEAGSENQRTPVVTKSGLENKRESSQKRRDSSDVKNKAIVSDPVMVRSNKEEIDEFMNQVIKNAVSFLVLVKEHTEDLIARHDSAVNTTGEHVANDTKTTKESTPINPIKESTEIVLKDQEGNVDTTDEHVVNDTKTTKESIPMNLIPQSTEIVPKEQEGDVVTADEHVVNDTKTTKEYIPMNLIPKSTEIVPKEQGGDVVTADEHVVNDTNSVSVSSSVLSDLAESAVKDSLLELFVVDNVNQSAVVTTAAAKARRSPRTVNDFIEMIGVPHYSDSSNLHLPDVDI